MKDTSNMTTGEAAAYRQGYEAGLAARQTIRTGPHIECKASNPDVRCRQCNCWKMTREYSS